MFGFALAGGGTNWSLADGLGGGKSDAFQAGVYAAARSGPAYLAASLAFANHWMSTDRNAAFGNHLTAGFNAQSIGARVESGYRVGTPAGAITPYGALQAQSFHTPAYSETDVNGGGFGLTYNTSTAHDIRSELGARFDHVALVDPTAVLTLRGRLAWAHDWVSDPSLAAVFQALPGASFIVTGATPAKDFRARLRRRRAQARQRRDALGQARRRARQPRTDLHRHRDGALGLVARMEARACAPQSGITPRGASNCRRGARCRALSPCGRAAGAVRVVAPSPLAGEGCTIVQRIVMGEGFAQQCTPCAEIPSPFLLRCTTIEPSPARGEGATTRTAPAA